jgi:hypothetical protein
MSIKRIVMLLAVISLSVSSIGCAFGTRAVNLRYNAKGDKLSPKEVQAAIEMFEDVRGEKDVGEVRNGFGMKTASVVLAEGQDVGAWAANAIADELTRRGYLVNKIKDAVPEGHNILVTGSVKKAYVRMGVFTTTASVEVSATVFKKGLPVLDETFAGSAKRVMMLSSAGEYASALEGALHKVMEQMLPKIEEAIG